MNTVRIKTSKIASIHKFVTLKFIMTGVLISAQLALFCTMVCLIIWPT
jgi:hypothetical protein